MARVLVVDDSAVVIRFIERALAEDGHTVEALGSFIQLAATVRNTPPDVIVLDLNIPALSGVSMGRIIRTYQSRHIPILVYSSAPHAELKAAALAVGAQSFVQKSNDPDQLRRAIDQILIGRQVAHR